MLAGIIRIKNVYCDRQGARSVDVGSKKPCASTAVQRANIRESWTSSGSVGILCEGGFYISYGIISVARLFRGEEFLLDQAKNPRV